GGAPWGQALVRLVAGGDGGSPVPAAAKAAAVGIGALALVGGAGDVPRFAHRVSTPAAHAKAHRHARANVPRVAAPAHVAVTPRENRTGSGGIPPARARPDERVSRERGGHVSVRTSGESTSGRSSTGSDDKTATTAVAQPTTDGGGSSSGPGPGSGSSHNG